MDRLKHQETSWLLFATLVVVLALLASACTDASHDTTDAGAGTTTSTTTSSRNPCAPKGKGVLIPIRHTSLTLVAVAKSPELDKTLATYPAIADLTFVHCVVSVGVNHDDKGREVLMFQVAFGTTQSEVAYLIAALYKTGMFVTVTEQRP